jgi:hypothetical protein
MKWKLSATLVAAASAALVCTALVAVPGAKAGTTYYYTGGAYTQIETSLIGPACAFGSCVPPMPNPTAAEDAAKFGTNMTGFVTFDFDTSGVSETFLLRTGLSDIFVSLIGHEGQSGSVRFSAAYEGEADISRRRRRRSISRARVS